MSHQLEIEANIHLLQEIYLI